MTAPTCTRDEGCAGIPVNERCEPCRAIHQEAHPDTPEIREYLQSLALCEGHPAGEFDPIGITVYCDGSCR